MTTTELSRQLQRCRRALAMSREGHWERHLPSGEVWFSDSFYALCGLPTGPDGVVGLATWRLFNRVHPNERPLLRRALRQALRTGGSIEVSVRFIDAAGLWRWVRVHSQVWPDAQGQRAYLSGSVTDIHREHMAVLALEESSRGLEAQVSARTEGLAAALAEAETRLAEAQHDNALAQQGLQDLCAAVHPPLNPLWTLADTSATGHAVLGMAVAYRLAQRLGGSLAVDCPAGGGTVFTLSLHLPPPEDAPASLARARAPHTDRLAWLVSDNPADGAGLAHRLVNLGWRCQVLPSLAEANARARLPSHEAPQLVLLAEPGLPSSIALQLLRDALPLAVLRLVTLGDMQAQARLAHELLHGLDPGTAGGVADGAAPGRGPSAVGR